MSRADANICQRVASLSLSNASPVPLAGKPSQAPIVFPSACNTQTPETRQYVRGLSAIDPPKFCLPSSNHVLTCFLSSKASCSRSRPSFLALSVGTHPIAPSESQPLFESPGSVRMLLHPARSKAVTVVIYNPANMNSISSALPSHSITARALSCITLVIRWVNAFSFRTKNFLSDSGLRRTGFRESHVSQSWRGAPPRGQPTIAHFLVEFLSCVGGKAIVAATVDSISTQR